MHRGLRHEASSAMMHRGFSIGGALSSIRTRGSNLKDRVRDHIVARTSQSDPSAVTAEDLGARLELDARALCTAVDATECAKRWLRLLCSTPQPRDAETSTAATGSDESLNSSAPGDEALNTGRAELRFRQVFLRSRALELALDAAARAPELRAHLQKFLLHTP